jgi:hypothetical protein
MFLQRAAAASWAVHVQVERTTTTLHNMLKWTQGIVEVYACDAIAGNWLCCAAASTQTPGKLRCEKKTDVRFC